MSAYLSRLRLQLTRYIEVLIFQYLIATLLDQMLPTVRSCASVKRCFEEQPVCFLCLSRIAVRLPLPMRLDELDYRLPKDQMSHRPLHCRHTSPHFSLLPLLPTV